MAIITLLSTNVYPLPPSDGFPEREFLTNVVQTTRYEFGTNVFTQTKTNSSIVGVYLPVTKTNLVQKKSYRALPGQLGQPIDAITRWHQNSTNVNSAVSPQ